jgi:plasmid stabilization system protein ParE
LVAERLYDATATLELLPRSGRIVRELGRDDLRELIVGDYRIVYRLEEGAAVLLTVFRGSRLLPLDMLDV